MGPPHSSSPASHTTLSPRHIAAVLCIIHHVPHRLGLTAFTFRAWFLIYRQEEGGVYLGSGMANGPRLRFSTTIMAIKVGEFHYCETALLDYQTVISVQFLRAVWACLFCRKYSINWVSPNKVIDRNVLNMGSSCNGYLWGAIFRLTEKASSKREGDFLFQSQFLSFKKVAYLVASSLGGSNF